MTNKEAAFQKVSELVKRFGEQYESYKKSDYNETLTRRDFIDPFFKALGWDVDNENGYAESYREVIHEDKVKDGKSNRAPDYSFRLVGGKRLFFVEAKKPAVYIKDEIQPAYQVRRYGWNAKLPVCILTDFEEFAVYDCTQKPNNADKPHVGRIAYFTFREYNEKFDFLWETFAKEQVLKGSFDRFVQSDTHKKGTATVDKEFLQSLDNWRTYLATSVSWNNKTLTEEEINYVVQQTIDRVIFLRIAEDRGIEPENNLKHCIQSGDFYQNLFQVFKIADEKYNSGLFDFSKDKISHSLIIDNKVIKNLVEELYYPKSEYEFGVMPVEILGTAYEQFLGKIIRITPAHHAKIEEKPEVRKAGGVYYTPQYIVDYIVKNTVGTLVEGKTPKEVSELKIVDPACGSGSFLLGAYQFLLDWHKDYYSNHGKPSKGSKSNPLTPTGSLTTAEKKRILLNNIYGVDIDVNAVEVTKLSLLLKCLEGETEASINSQFKLFNERVLPSLDHNIQSGNSLIDTDFYSTQLDFGDEKKIKPFNWVSAFPEVFRRKAVYGVEPGKEENLLTLAKKAKHHAQKTLEYVSQLEEEVSQASEPEMVAKFKSGFDVVIGNPPYVRIQTINTTQTNYFKKYYHSANYGNYDLYVLFIEKTLKILNSTGRSGMILPNKFFTAEYGNSIRLLLAGKKAVSQINNFTTNQVFTNATTYTCLLFLSNIPVETFSYQKIELVNNMVDFLYSEKKKNLDSECLIGKWNFVDSSKSEIFEKINHNKLLLNDICLKIFKGSSTGNDSVYLVDVVESNNEISTFYSEILHERVQIETALLRPFLYGSDVRRYTIGKYHKHLIFPYSSHEPVCLTEFKKMKKEFPLASEYFKKVRTILQKRKLSFTTEDFYKYSAARSLGWYNKPKILIPDLLVESRIAVDEKGEFFHGPAIHSVILKDEYSCLGMKYIAALLGSRLFWFFLSNTGTALRGNAYRLTPEYIKPFPVKNIDSKNNKEIGIQIELINLVSQLENCNHQLPTLTLESDRQLLKGKIDFCENRINQLVYELYGLTEEEIEIVESA